MELRQQVVSLTRSKHVARELARKIREHHKRPYSDPATTFDVLTHKQ